MLYKEDHDEDPRWVYTEWRYWCECTDPGHALLIQINEEDIIDTEISIINRPGMSLWSRIKDAIRLLWGKEVVYVSVMINDDDRKELAAVLSDDKIVT